TIFGLSTQLVGDPIRVESVKPRFASPGLEILGPRRGRQTLGTRWPPVSAGPPLRHHTQSAAQGDAIFGVRATSRGVYYIHDLLTLYKRGAKSFASTANGDWCVTVGHGKDCAIGYVPPPRSVIVEWGGPSRYGVPIRKALGEDTTTATYPLRQGERTVALTLSNLTSISRTVSDVHADVQNDAVTIAQPAAVDTTIQPHSSRRFLLDVKVPACRANPRRQTYIVDQLRADVYGRSATVPLSVALAFRTVSAC
ncbi:MAG: hypothetical protein QOF76_1288, partial [Solirubrobacteraceae bacterium]|nr:hypothetical protein [Solirubrobacteraceae bacterium]